jgi:hypothetical protein
MKSKFTGKLVLKSLPDAFVQMDLSSLDAVSVLTLTITYSAMYEAILRRTWQKIIRKAYTHSNIAISMPYLDPDRGV